MHEYADVDQIIADTRLVAFCLKNENLDWCKQRRYGVIHLLTCWFPGRKIRHE